MILNLHLVRVFYQVAHCQNFSKAAEKLFISQSAVSKAVRELEKQLDLPLIERGIAGTKASRGVKLTENGQALFEHARAIFSLEKVAIDDLQARLELKRGRLIIGASTTIASYWLPTYLTTFNQQYPDIELEIRVGNTEAMRQLLINCEIDLALVEGTIEDERININQWQQEELKIITAPEHNLTIKQLAKQLWVGREYGSGTYTTAENTLAALGIIPQQRLVLASNEGIARIVAAGTGIAILPARVVEDLLCLNKLKALPHPQAQKLTRTLYLLTLKERPISSLLETLIKQLNNIDQ